MLYLHDTVPKNSKNENILRNKTNSFNNIVITFLWICGHIRKKQLKQANLVYLHILFLLNNALFSESWYRKLPKKTLEYGSMLYIILLFFRLTWHPQNWKIKSYYFQERLCLLYNIILKLTISVSYMFLAK